MKTKLLSLFVALIATTALWASNTITYTASAKLPETTDLFSSGLHTNAFNVSISSHTFSNGIGTITFAGEVTSIGDRAFIGCRDLTSVTIPNSVTTIGMRAFDGVLNIMYNGTAIGSPWGAKCVNGYVDGYFVYSDVAKTTLCGCSIAATEEINIPSSVTTIGEEAFSNCIYLTSITIPNSVTTIKYHAFMNCSGLTKTNYTGTIADWCKIEFDDNPTWYSQNFFINDIEVKDLVIPEDVDTIGSSAFDGCKGLTSVTIGNSVTTIGEKAFIGCSGLTSVIIGNSVTTIGWAAFSGCCDLTSVTFPNSVTTIGGAAFSNCSSLTSPIYNANCFAYMPISYQGAYTIPDGIRQIAGSAFSDCTGLTSVTIPNSVTTIGSSAFSNCSSLMELTIPNSVTTIEGGAFNGCISLTSPICNATIFAYMPTLYKGSYTIPNGIQQIADIAFYECTSLTSINIPNSIIEIGENAFYDCTGLTSVTIGNSVTTIGGGAFLYCSNLTTITCYAPTPPVCGSYCFYNVDKSISLYVPAESINAYKMVDNWREFTNILPIGAESVHTNNNVTTQPSANSVTITWPQTDNADTYTLEIKKNNELVCTLTFNGQGIMTGIAFAPSRGAARELASAEMTANGWQFTVTGLNQASKYGYTLDALNASQQSIKHYEGEFCTDGYTGLDQLTDSPIDRFTKIIKDNQLLIRHNGKLYNALGGKVR